MSKAPAHSHSHSQIISAYPSCEHCITWSEAGIAVAGGENVYFASDRDAQSQHSHDDGRVQVLRVDTFDHDEWPDYPMASIADLSFGEEQSESIVVALAWSPPGLGIHRRCVLAVLTSNLVLSFWETNGSRNSWRRTCVINNHVRKQSLDRPHANSRQSNRVRAFVWLPPLKLAVDDHWGTQFLLTADDEKGVTLWKISKEERQKFGSWLVELVATGQLPDSSSKETTSMSALQLSLLRAQRVDRFLADTWSSSKKVGGDFYSLQIAALFNNSPSLDPVVFIEIQMTIHDNDLSVSLSLGHVNKAKQAIDETSVQDVNHLHGWEKELEKASADYRRKFQLRRVRVRCWGIAQSPNCQRIAAIVTLHPQDSYEYTTANTEKSWLLITQPDSIPSAVQETERLSQEVRKAILAYILHAVQNNKQHAHELDDRLLQIWTAWTGLQDDFDDEHKKLSLNLKAQVTERNVLEAQASDTQTLQNSSLAHTTPETCSLCQKPFPMDLNAEYAVCEASHLFPRCALSLLAIQEPRISKYCSKCDRQYLDLAKLGPLPPGTLIAELFDKFDTCPVCNGKFRG